MGWALVLPAVVTVVVGVTAGRLQRHLSPPVAAVVFAALAGLAAVAVGGAVVVLAAVFVVQLPWVSANLEWCRALAAGHGLPTWFGVGLLLGLIAMVTGVGRRRPRRRVFPPGTDELVVIPSDEPEAYAVPGRPGHIVVSAGMLRCLDDDERRVLLAHERAHLHRGHHRYVLVADVAATVVPMLRPLRDRVRFATERWADEDAALAVGDRRLVARAICRAALLQHQGGRALALAEMGVPARVDAMLDASSVSPRRVTAASAVAALVTVAVSSTWQLHHLAAFAAHVCGIR